MSFDAWFLRIRDTFNTRVGSAWDALMGKAPAPIEEDALMHPPLSRRLGKAFKPAVDENEELEELLERLRAQVPVSEDDGEPAAPPA
jgi:hypothetical protein